MEIAVSTYATFTAHTVVDAVKALRGAGFTRQELVFEFPFFSRSNYVGLQKKLVQLKKELGVEFTVHAPFSFEFYTHPDKDFRNFLSEYVECAIDLANALGSRWVVVHAGRPASIASHYARKVLRRDLDEWALENFVELLRHWSRKCQGKVCVENLSKGLVQDTRQLEYVLSKVPSAGWCFDIAHAWAQGNLAEFLKLKRTPDYMHLTDNEGALDTHWELGKGTIDWHTVKEYLRKRGYNGWCVLEMLGLQECTRSRTFWEQL